MSLSQAGKSISARLRSALGRLQKVRKRASQPLIFVGISVAFVEILALIYLWFRFNWTGWLLFLFILIGILIGILFLILLIQAGYTAQWTGFSTKTLWNWLKLLFQAIAAVALPISIIVGLFQFNAQQAASASTTLQQNAVIQAQVLDQQEEATLQTYLGDMSDLLLNHTPNLRTKPTDEIRQVAQVRTLTTLRKLNAERNRIVLRFLQDAHLIGIQHAVINLSNANLSGTHLSNADLNVADLSGTHLSNADLSGADLNGTILNGADLSGANLSGANLYATILNSATLDRANLSDAALYGADLSGADLSGATLKGTFLKGAFLKRTKLDHAILSFAILSGALLSGALLNGTILNGAILDRAVLSGTTLIYADLSGATLNSANLNSATLDGADLRGANLSGASLSEANLQGAKYNSKPLQMERPEGPFTLDPTQWPQGFNPQAAGAICVDC